MKTTLQQPTDIWLAIQTYYQNYELSSKDISQLFHTHNRSTISKLKKMAREVMAQENIMPWSSTCVNTKCAYEAWGLSITDLENRYKKLQKLKKI